MIISYPNLRTVQVAKLDVCWISLESKLNAKVQIEG